MPTALAVKPSSTRRTSSDAASRRAAATIDEIDQLTREYQVDSPGLSGPIDGGRAPSLAPEDQLHQLYELTGLTWEQVAKVFGVSKRAVMHWRTGANMSAGHRERLVTLLARAHKATADGTDGNMWLMAIDRSGSAPYQRWIREARAPGPDAAWADRQQG